MTYEQLAEVTGMTVGSLRSMGELRYALRRGDWGWVMSFIQRRLVKQREALSEEEVGKRLGKQGGMWGARWPKLDVYECALKEMGECSEELLLGGGVYCRKHGGVGTWRFGERGHFELKVGEDWVPYHRLVLQPPRGMHVHHVDCNKWNNRIGNLEVLTAEAHFERHHDIQRAKHLLETEQGVS